MEFDFSFVLFSLPAFILVFVRLLGLIVFNPFLSRKNMPTSLKTGLAFFTALVIVPVLPIQTIANFSMVQLVFGCFRELFIGFVCGYIFIIFYYLIFTVGDYLDMQMGFSMAKVMDPNTNMQSSLSGMLLSMILIMLFFSTNCHLILIEMFAKSYDIIPLNGSINIIGIPGFFTTLFVQTFALALKLALPIIAAEFIMELSLGILMKLIPQIHVFVINLQLKILLGCLFLIIFTAPIGSFLEKYLNQLMIQVENALVLLGS